MYLFYKYNYRPEKKSSLEENWQEIEAFALNNKIEISNIFINNKDYKNSVDILIKSIENKEIIKHAIHSMRLLESCQSI